MKGRKIGIMGGTFDPFHNSHLQVAKTALNECGLDRLEFMPSASPPHKAGETGATFTQRVNMIKLACEGIDEFSCNDIEGSLGKPSYSIDTLNHLQSILVKNCQLYFIIGTDAFLEINLWKSFKKVLQKVHFIISQRKGYSNVQLYEFLKQMGYLSKGNFWYCRDSSKRIYMLKSVPQDISSTLLKDSMKGGQIIDDQVPAAIKEYIIENGLYLEH